ncbi:MULTISPECIES: DUF2530 domain-containing protein [Dermacoccus]|uniref:DUF2530 domain-containing protein n=1 Tax=Dermacoccus TaxID=57495 RepID=UPI000AD92757|nr:MULTISPECIES: DUF2530 domain-containing protein [Dermacoccus]
MSPDQRQPKRAPRADGATPRSIERAREMRERAEHSMSYEAGVVLHAEGEARLEESPYEKLFTGGDTVIPKPQPLHVDTPKVILVGVACWVVMLVVTLLVPALHTGERDWWPWTCVAGAVLGLMGWAYVRRGRGNAEAA